MPIYEFACRDCSHRFEELVRAADPAADCPACGSARAVRLMSAFSVRSVGPRGNAVAQAIARGGDAGGCCGGACGCH